MQIGSFQHSAGDTLRYEVDYTYWLDEGRTLKNTGYAVSITSPSPAPADVMISQISVTADKLYFFVGGGSVNETFTVQVQVTDTLNEVVVDTISFTVTAP